MMLLNMSWRNIWRHPLRSSVLLITIVLGVSAGIFVMSMVNGMIQQRFKSTIERRLSHIQVHHPDYRSEQEVRMAIPHADSVLNVILAHPNVKSVAVRTLVNGMIATAGYTGGVSVVGIEPETEKATTGFDIHMIEGEYLGADVRNSIILGKKLADKLNVRLRSRVVLTFQNEANELVSAAFRVHGIYKSSNAQLDQMQVFVRRQDVQNLLEHETIIHEIAVLLHDGESFQTLTDSWSAAFPKLEVVNWRDISPELRYMMESGSITLYIFIVIILLGIGFGILNTMLMVVFERTREIGMLMAIGMNRLRVFTMILLETILLCFSGGVLGMGIAAVIIRFTGESGLNFANMADALAEFGYDAIIYPELELINYVVVAIMIFTTALLASIYPSIKAIRLLPADAVRG